LINARCVRFLIVAGLTALFLCCSPSGRKADIFVMEELEAAASTDDPEKRVERLEIFIENHPGHFCRLRAYGEVFDTLAEDLGRLDKAREYFDTVMAYESESRVRGRLHYKEFSHLWNADSLSAAVLAESLLASDDEKDFRLFVYMGMYFGGGGRDGISEAMFEKALENAQNSFQRTFAGMLYGELLFGRSEYDRALEILSKSKDNVFSHRYLGDILWKRGKREEALDSYITLVAGVPGEREEVRLDSLFALVRPEETSLLDSLILGKRAGYTKLFRPREFYDTSGKKHDLGEYRGTRMVIGAWSPT